ncbi:MAG: ATP-binding cassette domain-containing protein [Gammaproteobacteria bacterium]|nr:ATP-binding cassette domain-containing protein [Gammaproteobacteria bacterium]
MTILSRLFALLHAVSGLILLLFSGWFIAACAIAGYDFANVNFNYLLPAVVIRGLALTRIATGYAQMWTGHSGLLSKIKELRLRLFSQLKNKIVLRRSESTEALAQHSESIASLNMAWTTHMLGGVSMLIVASMTLWIWLNNVMWLWGIFLLGLIIIFTFGIRAILAGGSRIISLKNTFRHDSEHHIESASLWHLRNSLKHTDMSMLFTTLQRHQNIGEVMLWWVQILAYITLVALICIENNGEQYRGQSVLLVFMLLLLSAKDWLGQACRSQNAYSNYRESIGTFESIPTQDLSDTPIKYDIDVNNLALKGFSAKNRPVCNIDVSVTKNEILILKGGSGSGKTSILQAISGLLPHKGIKIINKQEIPQGFIQHCYYADQSPQILSASLSSNLRLAKQNATEEELLSALEYADLSHLNNLSEWLGSQGRQLSGGELKRMNIARAYLCDASIYLFDEPFEGLDIEKQNNLALAINQLAKNSIVIVASHIIPDTLNIYQTIDLSAVSI